MPLNHAAAKIADCETSLDAAPTSTPGGNIIWAEVRIAYLLAGLSPTVVIRVPVPWEAGETDDQRRGRALRCARELVDHACRAAGVRPETVLAPVEPPGDDLPAVLEGVAQELGLAAPSARPRAKRV